MYFWLCHMGVAWEGSRTQVGSKAREGTQVLQKQGGYQGVTWQRCGLPGMESSSPLGASLQKPSSSVGLLAM